MMVSRLIALRAHPFVALPGRPLILARTLAGFLLATSVAWANPNQHARVLAGLEAAEGSAGTPALAETFTAGRSLFRPENAQRMRDFFAEQVPRTRKSENVIYLFGGPDVLFPEVIFPNYKTLLLVGLEPAGELPDPSRLTSAERSQKIGDVARAYATALNRSYFVTSAMAKDLVEYGTTTIIATGLAVQGLEILSIQKVSLDAKGIVQGAAEHPTRGVRITFRRKDGSTAEIFYFRFNLADESMAKKPELARFIEQRHFDTAFYKAASFVSHNANFKAINALVLGQASLVVQADDGIPYSALAARAQAPQWSVSLYGMYTPPAAIFQIRPQPRLRALYGQAICRGAGPEDQALWEKVWSTTACAEESAATFRSVRWSGYLPFRLGYAAVLGPTVVPAAEMNRLGNLMVLER